MTIGIVGSIITSLVTVLLFWYSEVKSNQKRRKEITGRFVLKANLTYKIVGFITTFIGILLANAVMLHWNEEIAILGPVTTSIFLIAGILTLLFYYNYSIEFDNKRIIATNLKNSMKSMLWSEVDTITYSRGLRFLFVKSSSEKIVITQDSVGFISFIEMMETTTEYTAEQLKI